MGRRCWWQGRGRAVSRQRGLTSLGSTDVTSRLRPNEGKQQARCRSGRASKQGNSRHHAAVTGTAWCAQGQNKGHMQAPASSGTLVFIRRITGSYGKFPDARHCFTITQRERTSQNLLGKAWGLLSHKATQSSTARCLQSPPSVSDRL